jgi:hypothetical protein
VAGIQRQANQLRDDTDLGDSGHRMLPLPPAGCNRIARGEAQARTLQAA